MRLLNTTSLELEFFVHDEVPAYAILSHTWGDQEVTLEDLRSPTKISLTGWCKIKTSAEIARSLDLQYIWIDTCCIDKSSSSELSEAINSMFRWYSQSKVCLAYLSDVSLENSHNNELNKSRWFTRGWTLQELIAPPTILFFNCNWAKLGTRDSLKLSIEQITKIPQEFMVNDDDEEGASLYQKLHAKLSKFSVAQRMSWAARRVTTRQEDVAYCLMGIFDINMPLIYGEGKHKAFKRLQEEIIKSTDDDSIFSWTLLSESNSVWGLLAGSPAAFGNYSDHTPTVSKYRSGHKGRQFSVSNRGIEITLSLTPFPGDQSGAIFAAFLDCDMCRPESTAYLNPAILLQRTSWDDDTEFVRIRPDILILCLMNRIVLPEHVVAILDTINTDKGVSSNLLQEAIPRQVFVSNNGPTYRLPNGMIFEPKLHGPHAESYTLHVVSRSPTWQFFCDESIPERESYEVNFDLIPVPKITEMSKPVIFGAVELIITRRGDSGKWHVCLVAGLEPLQQNPFGIQGLYLVPWCAFETVENVEANNFTAVLDKKTRTTNTQLLQQLNASFDLERRYSRLFYRMRLDLAERVESKGSTTLNWFRK